MTKPVKPTCKHGGAHIDLTRYAGTYGGYIADKPKPLTVWMRFYLWMRRINF